MQTFHLFWPQSLFPMGPRLKPPLRRKTKHSETLHGGRDLNSAESKQFWSFFKQLSIKILKEIRNCDFRPKVIYIVRWKSVSCGTRIVWLSSGIRARFWKFSNCFSSGTGLLPFSNRLPLEFLISKGDLWRISHYLPPCRATSTSTGDKLILFNVAVFVKDGKHW